MYTTLALPSHGYGHHHLPQGPGRSHQDGESPHRSYLAHSSLCRDCCQRAAQPL